MGIAKVIELVGSSEKGWEDAAEQALKTASKSIRNISGVEIVSQTADVKNGQIAEYKTSVRVAFAYENE